MQCISNTLLWKARFNEMPEWSSGHVSYFSINNRNLLTIGYFTRPDAMKCLNDHLDTVSYFAINIRNLLTIGYFTRPDAMKCLNDHLDTVSYFAINIRNLLTIGYFTRPDAMKCLNDHLDMCLISPLTFTTH